MKEDGGEGRNRTKGESRGRVGKGMKESAHLLVTLVGPVTDMSRCVPTSADWTRQSARRMTADADSTRPAADSDTIAPSGPEPEYSKQVRRVFIST